MRWEYLLAVAQLEVLLNGERAGKRIPKRAYPRQFEVPTSEIHASYNMKPPDLENTT